MQCVIFINIMATTLHIYGLCYIYVYYNNKKMQQFAGMVEKFCFLWWIL